MFGSIGMPELIIILVIALIIFGPRKLPELGRSLGRSIGEFKRASNELRNTLEEEIRVEEQRDQRAAIRAEQDSAVEAAATPAPAPSTPVSPAPPADGAGARTTRTRPRASVGLIPFPKNAPAPMPDDDLVEGRDDLESAADDEMGGKMSFLDHLDELRRRIIYAVLSVGIGFVIAFFFIDDIFNFVMRPMQQLLPPGGTLVYTDPTEAFMLYIKIALISGLLLASPAVFTQVWLFVAPGLYAHEKKWAIPFVLMSTFFFILGAWFSHAVVFPITWRFFVGFASDIVTFMPRIEPAFSIYLRLILALGITFQLPTLVLFLARMGMITPRFMIRNFKYAVLLIIIAAAVLSPDGGGVGLIAMGGPVILLYVFSIGLAWAFGKKKKIEA